MLKSLFLGNRTFNTVSVLVGSPVVDIEAEIDINVIEGSMDIVKSSSTVEVNNLEASVEILDSNVDVNDSEVLSEL